MNPRHSQVPAGIPSRLENRPRFNPDLPPSPTSPALGARQSEPDKYHTTGSFDSEWTCVNRGQPASGAGLHGVGGDPRIPVPGGAPRVRIRIAMSGANLRPPCPEPRQRHCRHFLCHSRASGNDAIDVAAVDATAVIPAQAGMMPSTWTRLMQLPSFPRTRRRCHRKGCGRCNYRNSRAAGILAASAEHECECMATRRTKPSVPHLLLHPWNRATARDECRPPAAPDSPHSVQRQKNITWYKFQPMSTGTACNPHHLVQLPICNLLYPKKLATIIN